MRNIDELCIIYRFCDVIAYVQHVVQTLRSDPAVYWFDEIKRPCEFLGRLHPRIVTRNTIIIVVSVK